MYDNFDDRLNTSTSAGFSFERCQGFATADVSSGELVLNGRTDEWSMWCDNTFDTKPILPRANWSFRADVTFGTGFFAVGKPSYEHAGIWITDTEWIGIIWPSPVFEAGIARGVNSEQVPYNVAGERLMIQVDIFDDILTSHLWREGDRSTLLEVTYGDFNAPIQRPSFGVIGTSTVHQMWVATSPLPISFVKGDFNADDDLTVRDINLLTEAARSQQFDSRFDLNQDHVINSLDSDVWAHDLKRVWYGDANLNGEFGTEDFVSVYQEGKYETGSVAHWGEGDWDGDGRFSTSDLIVAFQDGGYERGPRPAIVVSIPEPSTSLLAMVGAMGLALSGRRERSR